MNNNEKMDLIFDYAHNLLDKSKKDQETITKLLDYTNHSQKKLNNTIWELDTISSKIKDEINEQVEYKSQKIANDITNYIKEDFREANKYAKEATERYKKAAKWSVFQTFLFSVIFFILLVLSVVGYYEYFLPNKIKNLNTQISEMERNIEELKKLNGDIEIKNCIVNDITKETKKCVNLDPEWIDVRFGGSSNKNLYIIKGY